MSKYYITTPIYYVNGLPHIGHAYTNVVSDTIARLRRLKGDEVKFLTGTDEHGQKIAESAIKQGKKPQKFVNEIANIFVNLAQKLNITHNDFIRTTQDRHKKCAQAFWQQLEANGHIYLGKYSGWYSIRDEAFFDESELTSDKLAPTGAPVKWLEEESYFFNLSKWQNKLLEFYADNPDFVYPKSRMNEVISFVKNGLKDLSISRTSFDWGIKVPGNNQHIIYVWLDALTNYLSALDYPDITTDNYSKFWPADCHVIGKDILRFHAIYWPAFLMAANLPLPKKILTHGWWTNEGQKISKSIGNVIDPIAIIDEFSLDAFRYFILREITFGNDGDYSRTSLINRINSELANKIGNLMQRNLSMIYKNCQKKIPDITDDIYDNSLLIKYANQTVVNYMAAINIPEFASAIGLIIRLAEEANIFLNDQEPWALKNTDKQKMAEILYLAAEVCRYIGIMLLPIIPDSASKMLDMLGVEIEHRQFLHLTANFKLKSIEISKPTIIFPKFESEGQLC